MHRFCIIGGGRCLFWDKTARKIWYSPIARCHLILSRGDPPNKQKWTANFPKFAIFTKVYGKCQRILGGSNKISKNSGSLPNLMPLTKCMAPVAIISYGYLAVVSNCPSCSTVPVKKGEIEENRKHVSEVSCLSLTLLGNFSSGGLGNFSPGVQHYAA